MSPTATPKAKTLELFGRRPNLSQPAGSDSLPEPFHVYSIRQAIEEGFILVVFKDYTSYKLTFKLAHEGISEAGSDAVQEKQKARLSEIIEKVNAPFTGELTENDKLVYVYNVILGKLLESETLVKQADSNTKEQFGNSPVLNTELTDGIMNAPDSLTEMSPLGAELRHNQTRTEIHPAESHQPV